MRASTIHDESGCMEAWYLCCRIPRWHANLPPGKAQLVAGVRWGKEWAADQDSGWTRSIAIFQDIEREAVPQLHAGSAQNRAQRACRAPLFADYFTDVLVRDAEAYDSGVVVFDQLDLNIVRLVYQGLDNIQDQLLHQHGRFGGSLRSFVHHRHLGSYAASVLLFPRPQSWAEVHQKERLSPMRPGGHTQENPREDARVCLDYKPASDKVYAKTWEILRRGPVIPSFFGNLVAGYSVTTW
jgi:hypothetical protein